MPLAPFPGTDSFTPGATPAGFGTWPTPNEAVGSDTRSAANLMTMGENLTDRTNWLGWRTIDIVSGGTYAFTNGVTLANGFTWNGSDCRFACNVEFDAAKTIDLGDPVGSLGAVTVRVNKDTTITLAGTSGHLAKLLVNQYGQVEIGASAKELVKSGGQIEVQSGGNITVDSGGNITINVGADLFVDGTITRTGIDIQSGSSAYRAIRSEATLPTATATGFAATDRDAWKFPNGLGADVHLSLATPSHPVGPILFYTTDPTAMSADYYLTLGSLTDAIKVVSSGLAAYASFTLYYTGTRWVLGGAPQGAIQVNF